MNARDTAPAAECKVPASLVCPRDRAVFRQVYRDTFRELAEAIGATALPRFDRPTPAEGRDAQ